MTASGTLEDFECISSMVAMTDRCNALVVTFCSARSSGVDATTVSIPACSMRSATVLGGSWVVISGL